MLVEWLRKSLTCGCVFVSICKASSLISIRYYDFCTDRAGYSSKTACSLFLLIQRFFPFPSKDEARIYFLFSLSGWPLCCSRNQKLSDNRKQLLGLVLGLSSRAQSRQPQDVNFKGIVMADVIKMSSNSLQKTTVYVDSELTGDQCGQRYSRLFQLLPLLSGIFNQTWTGAEPY